MRASGGGGKVLSALAGQMINTSAPGTGIQKLWTDSERNRLKTIFAEQLAGWFNDDTTCLRIGALRPFRDCLASSTIRCGLISAPIP